MSDILSESEIAALVAAARDGGTTPATQVQARRPRRIREVDFTRPTKFTQDQQRRIERAHESFCRSTATQLSAELRAPYELEVINIAQAAWSSALEDIPQPSLYGAVALHTLGTSFLLSAELPAVLRLLTRMLGGTDSGKMPTRDLTEIELALSRRVFGTLVQGLSSTWNELVGVELGLGALETQPQGVQLAPPSEPSLVVTIEVREPRASSTLSIVVPHRSIEPVLDRLPGGSFGEAAAAEADPEDTKALHTSMRAVDVELRAEVAAVELALEDVLQLQPGDVLNLGAPVASGVTLFADDSAIHRCRPGRSGSRRAVQVLERLEDGD